jgi:hypothetical protein
VASSGEGDVDGVAGGAGEEITAEMAVVLHMADDRLDAGTTSDLAANGGGVASP